MTPVPPSIWRKVWPDPSGCWLWTGFLNHKGYAQLKYRGRSTTAHRVMYELFVGPIAEGLQIDHLCRVRHCVNPKHLEPVTPRENVIRGLAPSVTSARLRVNNPARRRGPGDPYISRALPIEACREIAARYVPGVGGTVAQLAAEYGVHLHTVRAIAREKSYRSQLVSLERG